jgi:hypothetical protein
MNMPQKLYLRRSNRPLNHNIPGNRDQGGPSDPTNQASSGTGKDSLASVREALQLCIETGRYSLELGELDLNETQTDGILFESMKQRYERVRHSVLPMRLRFSKPDRVIFVKVSPALESSRNFFFFIFCIVQAQQTPLRISNSGFY